MSVRRELLSPPINFGEGIALAGGLAAAVLAILALIGIAARTTASLAAICIGAGLLGHGLLATRRLFTLGSEPGATEEHAKVGEAAGDEVLGGAGALALGILALIGFSPALLLGIAAIAAGGALLLAGPARPKLPHLSALRAVIDRRAAEAPTASGPKHTMRARP